mmetsp:Transcript_36367/g.42182  ORF Transcript_36367/g.42182 Transcript_36367/m.42182 type:complete len:853 (+) Transcript_36367:46-2604(+)
MFVETVDRGFENLGGFVAKNPLKVIAASLALSLIAGAGVTKLSLETDTVKLWVPTSVSATKRRNILTENYGSSTTGLVKYILTAKDGGSISRESILLEALEIHQKITTEVKDEDGKGFQSYCNRPTPSSDCFFDNILSVFDYDEDVIRASASNGTLISKIESKKPLKIFLFGAEYDDNFSLLTAKAIPLTYSTAPEYLETSVEFIGSAIDDIYWKAQDDITRKTDVFVTTSRSIDDEVTRLIGNDSFLFALSILAIVLVLAGSLFTRSLVTSRSTLGMSALLIIILSIAFSFGMMGWCGIEANTLCFISPFVVTGVSVDDIIIVLEFFQREVDKGTPAVERMPIALRQAGSSITLTSISTVVAFASAALVDIPGVKSFGLCAMFAFLWVYVLTCTMFVAFLALDQRRMDQGRGCLFCQKNGKEVPVTPSTRKSSYGLPVQDMFKKLSTFLKRPQGLLTFFLLLVSAGVLGYQGTINDVGLTQAEGVPDDSYVTDFDAKILETTENNVLVNPTLYIEGNPFTNPTKVQSLYEHFEFCSNKLGLLYPVPQWHSVYTIWLKSEGKDEFTDFDSNIANFFNQSVVEINGTQYNPVLYWDDVVCTNGHGNTCKGGIVRSKFLSLVAFEKLTTKYSHERDLGLNENLNKLGFNDDASFWYASSFSFGDSDAVIASYLVKNLLILVAAVSVVSWVFVGFEEAISIAICVSSILLSVVGIMKLWGVNISFISFSLLVMAVGLCVDYNAHVAHAFRHADKSLTAYERSERALCSMGLPVLKGGATTLAGTIFLAFSSSNVFRSVFKIMLCTVVFGCIYGLIALPVILPVARQLREAASSCLSNTPIKSMNEDNGDTAVEKD